MHQAVVAIAIGNKYFSARPDRHVGRHVETLLVFSLFARRAEGEQNLAAGAELADYVQPDVGHPNVSIPVDLDVMGIADRVVSPGPHEFAFGRVDLNRRLGTGKDPDIVFRIDRDARHVPPLVLGRLMRPLRVDLVPRRQVHPRIVGEFRFLLGLFLFLGCGKGTKGKNEKKTRCETKRIHGEVPSGRTW